MERTTKDNTKNGLQLKMQYRSTMKMPGKTQIFGMPGTGIVQIVS